MTARLSVPATVLAAFSISSLLAQPAPPSRHLSNLPVETNTTLSQRTFVASTGSDAAACSRTAPCRNFAAAVAAVTPGGEVVVLDSAGYGPVTVDKSVSIIAPLGVYAGITAFSGAALQVAALTSDTVLLRGLTLNNLGADNGILVTGVGDLHISNCLVSGTSSQAGIFFQSPGQLYVGETIVKEFSTGIEVWPSSGSATALIERVSAEKNGSDGFVAVLNTHMTVTDSQVMGGSGVGFHSSGNANTILTAINCTAAENAWGFSVDTTGSLIRVSRSAAVNGSVGFGQYNGTFQTLGDNVVRGNTNDTVGAITGVSLQ